jgi:hypothetical protein
VSFYFVNICDKKIIIIRIYYCEQNKEYYEFKGWFEIKVDRRPIKKDDKTYIK